MNLPRGWYFPGVWLVAILLASSLALAQSSAGPAIATSATTLPLSATSPSTTRPSTQLVYGKDVLMLDDLLNLYEPVPFAHARHAEMAETWDGCVTCHHREPNMESATTRAVATAKSHAPEQADTKVIPACKSCHSLKSETPEAIDPAGIQMPNLKGAYHRQCLNCHREWMDSNACVVCHAARKRPDGTMATTAPSTGDIVSRMHQNQIKPPLTKEYDTRFTPAAGGKVLFRHDEHVAGFGIRCVNCHRRDSCSDCHKPTASSAATKATTAASSVSSTGLSPLQPGRTWKYTHGPCLSCHQNDNCNHCHYQPGQAAPTAFDHRMTGQALDKDHVKLTCAQCHSKFKANVRPTCGDASCHEQTGIGLPKDRPGKWTPAATRPSTRPATQPGTRPTTQPATRPILIRIRRGGS